VSKKTLWIWKFLEWDFLHIAHLTTAIQLQ